MTVTATFLMPHDVKNILEAHRDHSGYLVFY